jgi:iron complex transport system substrate-binding protein
MGEMLDCMLTVAAAAGIPERGRIVVDELRGRIEAVRSRSATVERPPRVFLLEWLDPLFGCGHWSPEIVRIAGGEEVVGKERERSRQVSWEELLALQPEVLLIACCGMTVERTLEELPLLSGHDSIGDLPCVRNERVYVMDGAAYFSRPGPRLVDSLEILAHALHPSIHPLPDGMEPALNVSLAEQATRTGNH